MIEKNWAIDTTENKYNTHMKQSNCLEPTAKTIQGLNAKLNNQNPSQIDC